MKLDDMSIQVRERNVAEIFDLAIRLCHRHLRALVRLCVVAVLPWMVLDWWLLTRVDWPPGGRLWLTLQLVSVQLPLLTAPFILFFGDAMFNPSPSAARALSGAWRRTPVLVALGLWSLLLSIAILPYLAYASQLPMVALLERPPAGETWRRARRLAGFYYGENTAILTLNLLIALAVLLIGATVAELVAGSLGLAEPGRVWEDLGEQGPRLLWPWLLLGPVLVYTCAVRFCAYLDLRTRREGWEIELRLRRLGRRWAEGEES